MVVSNLRLLVSAGTSVILAVTLSVAIVVLIAPSSSSSENLGVSPMPAPSAHLAQALHSATSTAVNDSVSMFSDDQGHHRFAKRTLLQYCDAGYSACSAGGCCANGYSCCSGTACCLNSVCCNNGNSCCTSAPSPPPPPSTGGSCGCSGGFPVSCCSIGECCPSGTTCCSSKACCPAGTSCSSSSGTCVSNTPAPAPAPTPSPDCSSCNVTTAGWFIFVMCFGGAILLFLVIYLLVRSGRRRGGNRSANNNNNRNNNKQLQADIVRVTPQASPSPQSPAPLPAVAAAAVKPGSHAQQHHHQAAQGAFVKDALKGVAKDAVKAAAANANNASDALQDFDQRLAKSNEKLEDRFIDRTYRDPAMNRVMHEMNHMAFAMQQQNQQQMQAFDNYAMNPANFGGGGGQQQQFSFNF